jgi:acyl-homoserine lactone acylase PvdQ
MADVDKAVWIQAPGQSGRVSSPYYMDQVDKWLSGDVYDMLMSKSKVIQAAKASQTLVQSE